MKKRAIAYSKNGCSYRSFLASFFFNWLFYSIYVYYEYNYIIYSDKLNNTLDFAIKNIYFKIILRIYFYKLLSVSSHKCFTLIKNSRKLILFTIYQPEIKDQSSRETKKKLLKHFYLVQN